jgi:hypothetical protein
MCSILFSNPSIPLLQPLNLTFGLRKNRAGSSGQSFSMAIFFGIGVMVGDAVNLSKLGDLGGMEKYRRFGRGEDLAPFLRSSARPQTNAVTKLESIVLVFLCRTSRVLWYTGDFAIVGNSLSEGATLFACQATASNGTCPRKAQRTFA